MLAFAADAFAAAVIADGIAVAPVVVDVQSRGVVLRVRHHLGLSEQDIVLMDVARREVACLARLYWRQSTHLGNF